MNVASYVTKVFRSVITSGAQFEEYVDGIGRPRFAVSCGGDDPGGAQAAPDEWLFSNDIDCLMRAFLDWDARGIRMEFDQPDTQDADVAASWTVVGLPAHFNDATSNLNSGLLGVMSSSRFSTTHGRTILLRCARAATTASSRNGRRTTTRTPGPNITGHRSILAWSWTPVDWVWAAGRCSTGCISAWRAAA
jgi:hypothetical protein